MTTPDDAIPVAAELALGLLDGEDRAEALRRVLADPVFAREVDTWRLHFAMLFAEWPDAAVEAGVEQRIFNALAGSGPGSGRSVSIEPRRPNRWAWATGAATLVAASLVLALTLRPERVVTIAAPPVARAAPLVAAIAPTTGTGKPFAAVYDADRGEIRLAGEVTVPEGHSAELWSIGPNAIPNPLGVFNGKQGARITIGGGNLARIADGVTLAVSIEPTGGSPTGLPTGPVVATGILSGA